MPDSPLDPNAPRPTGRAVYESTLLPPRRHRRVSPWLVVPGLLLALGGVFSLLLFGQKPRRVVPTAGLIVYAADSGSPGVSHLWAARTDGSAAHALSSGMASDSSPTFSADGSQIVFLSTRAGGQNQIYVMDGDGANTVQVTRGGGAKSQPAFAPGSNSLVGFLSGGSLAVSSLRQGDISILLPPPAAQAARPDAADPAGPSAAQIASATVTAFAWKPATDGAAPGLAAVLETGGVQALAVLPTLSSKPRLTQNDRPGGPPLAAADGVAPAWAPGGGKMAVALLHVQGLAEGRKASGLIQLDALGNVQHALLPVIEDPAIGPLNPVYSPDGSLIAFEVWRQADLARRARLGLYLLPSGGGTPKQIAAGDSGAAQFSPDSRQVFFLRRRADGGHDLFRIGIDGGGLTRISDGRADVTGFALSPQVGKL